MVKGYMETPRSVMLVVVLANTDLATQEILELATEAGVHGDRTLGVLTKPDLVDKGAESSVVDLVEGRARSMKLGWHIIRNPGQKELRDTTLDRDGGGRVLPFLCTMEQRDKVGVNSLRVRLKEVLSALVKREFPKLNAEVQSRLESCRRRLQDLGPERETSTEQMAYLIDLASKFQRLVSLALNATHGADDVFETSPVMRIAPSVMSRLKTFLDEMARHSETYSFSSRTGGIAEWLEEIPANDVQKTFTVQLKS